MRHWVLALLLLFSVFFENEGACAKKKKAEGKKSATIGLTSDNPAEIRDAVQAIKKSRRPKDLIALENRIAEGLPPDILLSAVDALASAATGKRLDTLIELSSHRNVAVRKKIVKALAKKSNNKTNKALFKLLDDPSSDVRAEAARAIGNSALKPGMKHLKRAAEQGLPEAAQIIGQKAKAPEAKSLIAGMNKRTMVSLIPTYKILASRRDLPHKLKMSLIEKLVKLDTIESRTLLGDLAKNLSKWDPMRLAAEKAYNKSIGKKDPPDKKAPAKEADKQDEKESSKKQVEKAAAPKTKPDSSAKKPAAKKATAKKPQETESKSIKKEESEKKEKASTGKPKSAPSTDKKEQK